MKSKKDTTFNWNSKILKPSLYEYLYGMISNINNGGEYWKYITKVNKIREHVKSLELHDHIISYNQILYRFRNFPDRDHYIYLTDNKLEQYVLDFIYLLELRELYGEKSRSKS